jgi:hypothetical protein
LEVIIKGYQHKDREWFKKEIKNEVV